MARNVVTSSWDRGLKRSSSCRTPVLPAADLLLNRKVLRAMKDKVNVAVVGATGAVGEVIIQILEERDFPVDTLVPLASERSVGKT